MRSVGLVRRLSRRASSAARSLTAGFECGTIRAPARVWKPSKVYLTENVYNVVLQKSIFVQIRQLIRYSSNDKGQVDGFVRELTFEK